MNCPENIVLLMHKYLDKEITSDEENELKEHLGSCNACSRHFQELNRTDMLLKEAMTFASSEHFTAAVMNRLPEEKRFKAGIWFRNHPILSAASLFLFFMAASLISAWSSDHQFSVSNQHNLVVRDNTVIVPKNEVVRGDVMVKNGTLRIEGTVDGNVTVINGEEYKASAGRVTGKMEKVNALFEWLWYRIKSFGLEVAGAFS
ncbi:zf-HC2 domain-containing protein [Metabacillus sp. RGM 3146]|uniref:zf-HC2 domain-containing protein n=1 Tax=Metabacillus sp. RGM 3146 TaxID=3401092 RepID=UPI003B9D1850